MTQSGLSSALKAIALGQGLPADVLESAFEALLTGTAAPEETGAFLMGLAVRGETADELIAGARIMRHLGFVPFDNTPHLFWRCASVMEMAA